MALLNYSSFAHIVYKYMKKKNMTAIATSFFEFLIDEPYYIQNEKGEPYSWNSREATEWFRCKTNIYPNLREAAAKKEIVDSAPDYIGDVIEELIYENQQPAFYKELYELAEGDETIPSDIKHDMENEYDDGNTFEFVSKVFLYSVTRDNTLNKKPKKRKNSGKLSLNDLIANIKVAMAELPRPIIVSIPDEPNQTEMVYVKALMAAYSEKEGVIIVSREELKKHKDLEDNFSRQRKSYYAAESVRESLRDTFQEKDQKEFDNFKKDIYDGVIDVVEDDHKDGYSRLNKTLIQAASLPLNSLISMIPGWITPEVKKGVCHMLVNDKKIEWVKKNEKAV